MMNKYPHFKTNIGGLEIHFQHGKSLNKKYKKTYPILVLHGWPSSFIEYEKLIPILTEPKETDVNFEVRKFFFGIIFFHYFIFQCFRKFQFFRNR